MDDKDHTSAIKRFFSNKRDLFQSWQDFSFERSEKMLNDILKSESKPLDYPIPLFAPILLLWMFIVLFPLVLILDPGFFAGGEVNARNIVGFYFPLVFTFCIFHINQKILVPNFVFKKNYAGYFVLNSILVVSALFIREIAFFLLDRTEKDTWVDFFHSYCFSAVKGHFSLWSVLSFVLLITLICIICFVYHVMVRQIVRTFVKREKKRMQLQDELDFLKSQLSPHFLSNTLNNITSLIRIDPKTAESSMTKLSKLLRVMLYQTTDEFINLKEDVDILQKYADLEKLRLNDTFDFKFEVHLENPDRYIEPLLVMPLMENALKHSVNPMGESFAHISIEQVGDEFRFHSENSNFPRKSKKEASGLGLATFEKRLILLYENRFEYSKRIENDVYVCDLKIILKR